MAIERIMLEYAQQYHPHYFDQEENRRQLPSHLNQMVTEYDEKYGPTKEDLKKEMAEFHEKFKIYSDEAIANEDKKRKLQMKVDMDEWKLKEKDLIIKKKVEQIVDLRKQI